EDMRHGTWMDWLKANFKGSYETAHAYIAVAEKWHQIGPYLKDDAGLSIRRALKFVRKAEAAEKRAGRPLLIGHAHRDLLDLLEPLRNRLRELTAEQLAYWAASEPDTPGISRFDNRLIELLGLAPGGDER